MSVAPDVGNLKGQKVISSDGAEVGTVADVFIDSGTGEAEFLEVKSGGRLRSKTNVVPIEGASAEGGQVQVPFDEARIKNAPSVDAPAGGELGLQEEAAVREHYGVGPDAKGAAG